MPKEKLRVLLVEDNPTDALIVKKRLQKDEAFSYEISHAISGEDALAILEKEVFDVTLLDYNLPKKSGMEVLRDIKSRNIAMPVVMITGQGDEAVAVKLIKEGAFDYLPKRENYEESVPLMVRKTIVEFRAKIERERLQEEIALKKDELEKANARLKELDRMKSDFVANVAHELRTPLSIIKGNLENIEQGIAGEVQPKQKDVLLDVFRVLNRLARLISDLLDLSKIESGKMELKRQSVNIVELAQEAAKNFDKIAKDKNIQIIIDVPNKAINVSADKDKLTQVFVNLISNGIKFTDQGSVSIKVIEMQNEVQVEISDTGLGMEEGQLEKIFDKFVRIVADKREGTGLGLPIAKDIIGLHNGRIRVESQTGKGSKFIFNLPK